MIAIYVDDMNLIETPKELSKIVEYLKKFEVKNLGKIKLCLGLEFKRKANRILVHQSSHIERVLKHFNMDNAHPLSILMVMTSTIT